MAEARIKKFRAANYNRLEAKYGKDITDYFFFLKERHCKRSRNKLFVIPWCLQDKEIDKLHAECERLGIDLEPLFEMKHWNPHILTFSSREDYNLFRLQYNDKVSLAFDFEEIYKQCIM